jgi:rare lipoprotein A
MKKITLFLLFLIPQISNAAYQSGVASWYGKENQISCIGKRLQRKSPAAAHKYLPLGSWVKVTSHRSRKSVIVLIEDRGPYTKNRIIDLNHVAARQLGITKKGIDHVTLEVLR